MKKPILIILIGLTLSVSGLLAWYLLAPEIETTGQTANSSRFLNKFSGQIPASSVKTAGDRPISLSTRPAISLTQARDANKIMYYERDTGHVLSIRPNGTDEKVLSSNTLKNLRYTVWSPSTSQVISVFSEKTGDRFIHYSYTSKKSTPLPPGTTLATFAPDGNMFAYLQHSSDGETGTIFISTAGSTSKRILNTRAVVKDLTWPQKDLLSLVIQDPQTQTNALFTLTLDGKLQRVTDFWEELEVLWSLQGTTAVISLKDLDGTQQLFRKDLEQEKILPIDAPAHARQCAWSVDGIHITCGIDKSLSSGTVNAIVTQDLYEINTQTGDLKIIFSSSNSKPFAVEEITLSQLEESVVLIDTFDHKVYGIKKSSE